MFRKLLHSKNNRTKSSETVLSRGGLDFFPKAVTMNGRWQRAVETVL